MKPIKDKDLRELISQKIGSLEPINTDHLWEGIESGLPSSSSGFMTGILKCILFISSFISVITISDSSGFAKEPVVAESEVKYEVLKENTDVIVSEVELAKSESNPTKNNYGVPDSDKVNDRNLVVESKSKDYLVSSQKDQPTRRDVQIMETRTVDLTPVQQGFFTIQTHTTSLTNSRSNQSQLFVSISPYLTFHSMLPNSLDENYVVGSASTSTTLADRMGLNVSIGYWKMISSRWVVTGSVGFDYYQTQFAYQVANYIDSEVLLKNHRLDGGLSLGVGYRINTPLGTGVLLGESSFRQRIHELNTPSSYSQSIAGYRFSYLMDLGGLYFGPTYASFFNSMNNEMGQVKPHIFGFTLRRNIR